MDERLGENEPEAVNRKNACKYCASVTKLHPLSPWDNSEEIHYYCDRQKGNTSSLFTLPSVAGANIINFSR